jgi:ribokinase
MAAVGHVEWVQFARVEHVPAAGEVVHARDPFEEPAGGGAVAAVQLARLAGGAALVTALGRDDHGERSLSRLRELGVDVHAQRPDAPTRRAITLLDSAGERTITTLGPRLAPQGGAGALDWARFGRLDGAYFTAGDLELLRALRERTRVLVASPRAGETLASGVRLDALVYSGDDQIEVRAARSMQADAELVVITAGEHGGSYRHADGRGGEWRAQPLPGPRVDTYGSGDSFAAGLTFALARECELDAAIAFAARCGAICVTGHGPYGRQLQGCAP